MALYQSRWLGRRPALATTGQGALRNDPMQVLGQRPSHRIDGVWPHPYSHHKAASMVFASTQARTTARWWPTSPTVPDNVVCVFPRRGHGERSWSDSAAARKILQKKLVTCAVGDESTSKALGLLSMRGPVGVAFFLRRLAAPERRVVARTVIFAGVPWSHERGGPCSVRSRAMRSQLRGRICP